MDIQTGRPVRPIGAFESLEQQLSCPICLDIFSKPVVILPCQHNLCRSCANDLYESKNPYHYSGGSFRCPTCRFDVLLDRHGVYGLQRNLLVENIIDTYKQQQQSGQLPADEPPLKDKDAKEPQCAVHEDERVNIFCVSCQTPTCSMCKVFGQHRDCEVAPLHDVYVSHKSELRAAVELLAAGSDGLQATVTRMEETRRLVEESGELQRRRLGESFDLLLAHLEDKKAGLLERISCEERDRLAEARALKERCQQQLEISRQLQEKMRESLERCGTAELLLSAPQLQEEVQRIVRDTHLQRPDPSLTCMEHLSVDTQEVEALLANMDFNQEEEEEEEEKEEN